MQGKLHIFWEGHKILRNLHCRFDCYYIGQIYGGDFEKFCGFLRIYELYLKIGHKHYVFIVIKIAQNPGFKYLVAGLPTWLPSKPHVLTHLTIGLSARGTHQGYISMTLVVEYLFWVYKIIIFWLKVTMFRGIFETFWNRGMRKWQKIIILLKMILF